MRKQSYFKQKSKVVFMIGIQLLLALGLVSGSAGAASAGAGSGYWTAAQETHDFTVGNLLTSYHSYRTSIGDHTTTEWYNASQIYADAAMVRLGDSSYLPYLNDAYAFMSHMWDFGSPIGGYFALGNIDGTGAGGDKYVDDASLTGNAYLDAYEATSGTTQTNYLNSAIAIANWLMNSGLWDSTSGGGFWWTTNKTIPGFQIKGSEVNALACQLFLRLYRITGADYYKQWADSIYDWLNSEMLDSNGLYNWEYDQGCGCVQTAQFTYDNAIMIEVNLLYKDITGDNAYLTKAEALATNMNSVLWNTQNSNGAFIINTWDPRLSPVYSGWASQSFIKLYEADGNIAWLNTARQNIDTLNDKLRNTADLGYYSSWSPAANAVDDMTCRTVNQAWMQRVQALMSQYGKNGKASKDKKEQSPKHGKNV
ncbi:glycoside hydrolase family 76 protein [Cohnella zeiphila]|uniref:AGE family epimerase/isomerase n=1 Tax=Cohnella zeiphila TaxID=2761120 RepID=A0A7X0SRI7_9BACL|nr:glycoside hydrolase family 76 protein [Cohnella zeiphila]MBB6734776.1 AGE family epimerase/isomerase [Cohnella zeiphila]